MIDLYSCDPALLEDEAFLRNVLDEYPNRIGMEKVSPIELRDIKTSDPLDDGFSGFVIIATSHVSLHAWPPYGMVNIDIFSCEEFDTSDVLRFATSTFRTNDVEMHCVERATRSPRLSVKQRMQQDRSYAAFPELAGPRDPYGLLPRLAPMIDHIDM
jgi:S-adenosylmethionine decarboxylase